jgi:hypothetical protein
VKLTNQTTLISSQVFPLDDDPDFPAAPRRRIDQDLEPVGNELGWDPEEDVPHLDYWWQFAREPEPVSLLSITLQNVDRTQYRRFEQTLNQLHDHWSQKYKLGAIRPGPFNPRSHKILRNFKIPFYFTSANDGVLKV